MTDDRLLLVAIATLVVLIVFVMAIVLDGAARNRAQEVRFTGYVLDAPPGPRPTPRPADDAMPAAAHVSSAVEEQAAQPHGDLGEREPSPADPGAGRLP